jgi:serine protease Do
MLGILATSTGFAQEAFPEELKTREPKNIEEVKLLEQHVQELLKKIRPATVSVSGGSGVVINEEGYILTVAHVNRNAGRRVRITFPDGKQAWGETLGNHHPLDAGLIKIVSDGDFPYVEMADSSETKIGEWCLAVGFPVSFSRGKEPASRLGRVLTNRSGVMVSDCMIMGGDSGGPLFDLNGKVIGISSRVSGSLNSNMHVPVNVYKQYWDRMDSGDDIRSERDPNRGYLGIRGPTNQTPPEIDEIVSGSAAGKAGLKVGDVVVEINDKKVESFRQVGEALSGKRAGDSITMMIRREGELIKLTIELGRR